MFPRWLGGSVRVFAALLTPWVFFTSVYFICFHNTTNFPKFSRAVIRQLLRKLRNRFKSTFLKSSKNKICNFAFRRLKYPHAYFTTKQTFVLYIFIKSLKIPKSLKKVRLSTNCGIVIRRLLYSNYENYSRTKH